MHSPLTTAFKYLRYWFTSSNGKGHGIHSPFVFQFITGILNDDKLYPEYEKVESLRKKLLVDKTVLTIDDLGAGSARSKKNQRSVASIARHAAKPKKYAQLLFRIAKFYQPSSILELGTSLGISTAYLSLAAPGAPLVSIEGSPAVAAVAKEDISSLGINNCNVLEGNFDLVLPSLLQKQPQWDLVFIDGNHRREPTLRYFELIMKTAGPQTVVVFDDIHWSREMEEAWDRVKADPRVQCSIDIFFLGFVFLRKEFHEKQDFTIRF